MRTFTGSNPYDEPEKCGLTLVYSLDEAGLSYEYNKVILCQDQETGILYAAHDSGCSCPTPFERVYGLDEMRELRSAEDFVKFLQEEYCDGDFAYSDVREAECVVERYVK